MYRSWCLKDADVCAFSFRRDSRQEGFPDNYANFIDDLIVEVFQTGGATNRMQHEERWLQMKTHMGNAKKKIRAQLAAEAAAAADADPQECTSKKRKGKGKKSKKVAFATSSGDAQGESGGQSYQVVIDNPGNAAQVIEVRVCNLVHHWAIKIYVCEHLLPSVGVPRRRCC